MEYSAEIMQRLCELTVELTKLRQNECKHLIVENVAPEILGKLIEVVYPLHVVLEENPHITLCDGVNMAQTATYTSEATLAQDLRVLVREVRPQITLEDYPGVAEIRIRASAYSKAYGIYAAMIRFFGVYKPYGSEERWSL